MSITFWTDRQPEMKTEKLCCLCAQMAPGWSMVPPEGDKALADLRVYADPSCPFCHGSGIEENMVPVDPQPNMSNDNAMLVLSALHLSGYYGEVSLPSFRRACVRALALNKFETRDCSEGYDKAHVVDGEIRRGCHYIRWGLDAENIRLRIRILLIYASVEASKGAKTLMWG